MKVKNISMSYVNKEKISNTNAKISGIGLLLSFTISTGLFFYFLCSGKNINNSVAAAITLYFLGFISTFCISTTYCVFITIYLKIKK